MINTAGKMAESRHPLMKEFLKQYGRWRVSEGKRKSKGKE